MDCLLPEEKKWELKIKKSKNIYWLLTNNWWYLLNWWCLGKFKRSWSRKRRRLLIAVIERSYCQWISLKRKKTQHFTCFYITILFQYTQNCNTNCNRFFCYENTQHQRTSTNRVKSFVWHWVERSHKIL